MKTDAHITRLDLVRMQLYLLFRIPVNFYCFAFIWLLMAFVLGFLLKDYSIPVYLLTVTLAAVCGFVAAVVVGVLMQLVFASEKHGFIGKQTFEVREDAFVEESRGGRTTTYWNSVSRVFRSQNYLFVMISMFRVHIVPRRAFDSDEHFQAFGDRVESLVSAA